MNANLKIMNNLIDVDQVRQNEEGLGRLLIEFTQLQELKVQVAMGDTVIERLEGPLDEIRWGDNKTACTTIIQALARSGLADVAELETKTSIVRDLATGKWNTSVSLYWCRDDLTENLLKLAGAIVQETLRIMFSESSQKSKGLFHADLPESHRMAVKDVVQEVLSKIGGRTIRFPMQVSGPQLAPCILDSKLAPKPSLAKFEPVAVDLKGKLRGFIRSHEKCVIFFHDHERSLIEIAFDPRMVGESLDLIVLTQWNLDSQECHVRAHQTIGSSGAMQFTLARISS